MHAFGLEETGRYGRVEESGRRAVALNPADAWAVHAVAHVMEMQDRHGEGEAGEGANAMTAADVGLPLCRAIRAFGAGRDDRAVDLLLAVRPVAQRFGGSHAQRDILSLTLAAAAHRAGNPAVAAAIAAERLDAKPASPLARRLMDRAAATRRDGVVPPVA
jgi:hypothetical protein